MRRHRLAALGVLVALTGCLTYVVAPAADPVKALKAPVYIEDMSKVTRNDSGAIRFILRVRAPKDTAIILLLGEQAQGLRGRPGRPAIRLTSSGADSSRQSLQRGPLLVADTASGGPGVVTVPAGQSRHVSILVTPGDTLPPAFYVDVTWYMRVNTDTALIERREDKSRLARMNKVPVAPVIGTALLAIIGFFLITTH
jgi:hypothetical protein